MAKGDNDDEASLEGEGSSKGSKSKVIIIVLVLLVLISGGGVVAALFLLGDDEAQADVAEEQQSIKKGPALYLAMRPPFVANYMVGSRQRYLQVELTLVTRDEEHLSVFKQHMPMIRNDIVSLLSQQHFEELQHPDGRDVLRMNILESLQLKLEEENGDPTVEDILFTSFVMQ